ncbi:MAG: lysophospholipid acyltransferase family protein [Acetanaerobacterium sp.]
MELRTRHKIALAIVRPFILLYCRLVHNLHLPASSELRQIPTPCFVIANHNSDFDPLFLSMCIPSPVFYVASDHIFRLGLVSKLLKHLFSPIPKLKSTSDIRTVRDILSALHSGANAGVFPEGNRSWCGETEEFSPAIGKLVHHLDVPLVVFSIHGAYLTSPRWGDGMRRGRIECRLMRVLTPSSFKKMSVDEINDLIKDDLHVDALQDQKLQPVRYHGANLAQSIETVLYACPRCGCFATIHSKGGEAFCSCGLRFRYDLFGELHGAPYRSIADWNRWQAAHLGQHLEKVMLADETAPIFCDEGQSLFRFERARFTTLVSKGRFCIYRDRFAFEGVNETLEFSFTSVSQVHIWGRLTLQFSLLDGCCYEVKTRGVRSAYKYLQAYKILKYAQN